MKIKINKRLNKSHLIIHQMLTLKALWSFQKIYLKSLFFLVIDTTLTSDNPDVLGKIF